MVKKRKAGLEVLCNSPTEGRATLPNDCKLMCPRILKFLYPEGKGAINLPMWSNWAREARYERALLPRSHFSKYGVFVKNVPNAKRPMRLQFSKFGDFNSISEKVMSGFLRKVEFLITVSKLVFGTFLCLPRPAQPPRCLETPVPTEWRQPEHTSLSFSPLRWSESPQRARKVRELSGWVGRWVGGVQSPSIFLFFKYASKQNVVIPNMVSKVVYAFLIKSYEQFKFQNSEI